MRAPYHTDRRRLSVAPMMDYTDRHLRYQLRLISKHVTLFTEMVTTGAVLRGDRRMLLEHAQEEHPVALQLGGDDAGALAECAAIAEEWGYDEVNLNCGCPSDRVVSGAFGASLMRTPAKVADALAAMAKATKLPVSVKHRIGVDDLDSYEHMDGFVRTVADAGCTRFTVHARKAWLQGLSPHQNRTIPPLRYEDVYRLKAAYPHLWIEINGGITSLDAAEAHLGRVDSVMIGRWFMDDPFGLADVDSRIYGDPTPPPTREEVARKMADYATQDLGPGFKPRHALRHLLPLFNGLPGARIWRRTLTEGMTAGVPPRELVEDALTRRSP